MRRPTKTLCALLGAAGLVLLPMWTATAQPPAADGLIVIDSFNNDTGTGQIYTVHADGSHLRQLTHSATGTFAEDPSWSADGSLIAYDASGPGNPSDAGIHVMRADGSGKRTVYDNPNTFDSQPAFFPSGHKLAFDRCVYDGPQEGCGLYTIRLDGTGLHRLTASLGHDVYDYGVKVSRDGSRVAFNRNNARGISQQVWVMDADGGHAHPVTGPAIEAQYPSWSPNDGRLVVGGNCCRPGGDLYTVSPNGGHQHRLTHTRYPAGSYIGAWSPSGSRIAFISSRRHPDGSVRELFVMNADGSHIHRVPISLPQPFLLDWAPAAAS